MFKVEDEATNVWEYLGFYGCIEVSGDDIFPIFDVAGMGRGPIAEDIGVFPGPRSPRCEGRDGHLGLGIAIRGGEFCSPGVKAGSFDTVSQAKDYIDWLQEIH